MRRIYLPDSANVVPRLESGGFPVSSLVLRRVQDGLEGGQTGGASTYDADGLHQSLEGSSLYDREKLPCDLYIVSRRVGPFNIPFNFVALCRAPNVIVRST